jgi:hypothetical protein
MSCIIIYKGKQYSEEQFKEYFINNKNEFATSISKNKDVIDSFKRKIEAIDGVFKDSPELASIGTKTQYMQYLSTIFKTSKVKDIVYHGKISNNPISKSKPDAQYGSAYYFTSKLKNTREFGKNIINALVNVKNPSKDPFEDSGSFTAKRMVEILNKKGYDAIDETSKEYPAQLVVFEPEQIHILGSKDDIEGFKNFVNLNNSNYIESNDDLIKKYALSGLSAEEIGDILKKNC